MEMTLQTENQNYVPAHLAIKAMRDNGYKNTAYAVAELIDNSIQADSDNVELLCAEREYQLNTRKTKRLEQIAILDNGHGMSEDVLSKALQFGNGTRLTKEERTGMGRFGMGLPASSISQGKCVEVYSWQNGIENCYYVSLDIDNIEQMQKGDMPLPIKKDIPSVWLSASDDFGDSGTLVVWSKLDRMMWSKGNTLVDHSEKLIGRMYRKFLVSDQVRIKMKVFDIDNPIPLSSQRLASPNDPLYLIENTSCDEPFHNTPMFEPYGGEENYEKKFIIITGDGEEHDIFVRFSIAKESARTGSNPGSKPHGKHASQNVGVSIVRASRELELDQTLVLKSDPRERWWGIEIEFPPSLDELMGVTNNKQTARNFSDILDMAEDIESLTKNKDIEVIQKEFEEEGDPRAPLIRVGDFINRKVKEMRILIQKQKQGSKNTRHNQEDNKVEERATNYTNTRKEEGYVGQSDKEEKNPPEERQKAIENDLKSSGVKANVAREVAINTVKHNLKYSFTECHFESDAFFTVKPSGGAINIQINMEHPAYANLVEVLDYDIETEENVEKLQMRLSKASEGLRLLLAAWARYEDERHDGPEKDRVQDFRKDWGRIARNFLKDYGS